MSKLMMESLPVGPTPRGRNQDAHTLNPMSYSMQPQMWYGRPQAPGGNFQGRDALPQTTQGSFTGFPQSVQGMPAISLANLMGMSAMPNMSNLSNMASLANPYANAFAQGFPMMPALGAWPFLGMGGFFPPQLAAQLQAAQAQLGNPATMAANLANLASLAAVSSAAASAPARAQAQPVSPTASMPPYQRKSASPPAKDADSGDIRIAPSHGGGKQCSSCGTSNTPVWREVEHVTLCNACGIRWRRTGLACALCKYVPRAHQIRQKSCTRCGKASKFLPCMSTDGAAKKPRQMPEMSTPVRKRARAGSETEDTEDEDIEVEPEDNEEPVNDTEGNSDDEYAPPRGGRTLIGPRPAPAPEPTSEAAPVPAAPAGPSSEAAVTVSLSDLSPAEIEATDVLKGNFSGSSLHILANAAN